MKLKFLQYPRLNIVLGRIYVSLLVLLGVLSVYEIAAFFVVKISCSYYESFLHQLLTGVFFIGFVPTFLLFVWHTTRLAQEKKWKKMIVGIVLIGLIAAAVLATLEKSILFCFLNGVNMDGFYWGPR